jgi:hypothetical protein
METSFKVSRKLGKYIQIDYVTGLSYLPNQYHKYVWCLNKTNARAFIKLMVEIEAHVKELLAKDNMTYDFRLIMCLYLQAIENIATGLDIRSDMGSLELANRFVFGYDVKYKEAHKFCQDTLGYVEATGKYGSYMREWKRYDKHNELVKEFNLPLKQLVLEDFRVNELKNIEHSLDEILKILRDNDE